VFDVANLALGPGYLLWATEGAGEPANLLDGWPGGWTYFGWTKEGHQWQIARAVEALVEPEQAYPTTFVYADEQVRVRFAVAELTIANWQQATPGVTATTEAWGTRRTARPATYTQATPVALAWQAFDMSERVIWRAVVQTAPLDVARRRTPDYQTLTMDFQAQRPSSGAEPWVQYLNDVAQGEFVPS
jgi:hypothetical protein